MTPAIHLSVRDVHTILSSVELAMAMLTTSDDPRAMPEVARLLDLHGRLTDMIQRAEKTAAASEADKGTVH